MTRKFRFDLYPVGSVDRKLGCVGPFQSRQLLSQGDFLWYYMIRHKMASVLSPAPIACNNVVSRQINVELLLTHIRGFVSSVARYCRKRVRPSVVLGRTTRKRKDSGHDSTMIEHLELQISAGGQGQCSRNVPYIHRTAGSFHFIRSSSGSARYSPIYTSRKMDCGSRFIEVSLPLRC